MTVSVVSPDLIASHGLTADEYDRIGTIIGRKPNLVELGMFGAMWSEL
jgi:phosphoribosylformylglycinamidine synthase subunit PurL